MSLELACRLWAKTDPSSNRWHALPYHLVDVGAAAGELFDRLPATSRRVAIGALCDEVTARRCVAFLAATHDIGKANRYFQAKDPRQMDRLADLALVAGQELATRSSSERTWESRQVPSDSRAHGGHAAI